MGRKKLQTQPAPELPETQCPHVDFASFAQNTRSLLNPRLWACSVCGTTERVWACLFCSFMGCGREVDGHALEHHKTTKHAVAMEVNDMYVHCYVCNCYVLNDNIFSDLATLRCNMRALATQSFELSHTRSGRVIRVESTDHDVTPHAVSSVEEEQDVLVNQLETADTHFKAKLLTKVMMAWREVVQVSKAPSQVPSSAVPSRSASPFKAATDRSVVGDSQHGQPIAPAITLSVCKKPKSLATGVTGLRNLGNTCYMNSVLQALGHLTHFREFFRQMVLPAPGAMVATSPAVPMPTTPSALSQAAYSRQLSTPQERNDAAQRARLYARQTTVECFNQLTMPVVEDAKKRQLSTKNIAIGLNGGDDGVTPVIGKRRRANVSNSSSWSPSGEADASQARAMSLVRGLHQLFRVTWSGKWSVATPSSLLVCIWRKIPSFRGHEQQDAQEFLSHLLERLEEELAALPATCISQIMQPRRQLVSPCNIIPMTFQGKLLSEVTCQTCGTRTKQREVFYDISLDFPDRYQARPVASERSCRRTARPPCQEACSLQDILGKFVANEDLGPIFLCNMCLGISKQPAGLAKRRVSRSTSMITAGQRYQPAVKCLRIESPPEVLRLHLKRFRWFHSSREKINVHVNFPLELDIRPYCVQAKQPPSTTAATTPPTVTTNADADDVGMVTGEGKAEPCVHDNCGLQHDEEVSLNDIIEFSGVFGKRRAETAPCDAQCSDENDGVVKGAADHMTEADHIYDLSSIIMHHGMGFNRGHYTSYCWNQVAKSWVHCNDARLTLCSEAEALQAQAYILFYVRRHGHAGTGYSPFSEDSPSMPPPITPLSPPFSPLYSRAMLASPSLSR